MRKKKFDRQEVFTHVLTFLRKQGEQSMMEDDLRTCAYRGKDGKMCAVGCLIPDEIMKENMLHNDSPVNDYDVINMLKEIYTTKSFSPSDIALESNVDFLSNLQVIHDSDLGIGMEEFNDAMKQFAEINCLEYIKEK